MTKIGPGTLTLTGSNTYSGNTTVDGGTLQIPIGSLASPNQYVGYSATGTLLQSDGANALGGNCQLYLAYNPSSSGNYNLIGSGQLSAWNELVGLSGTGSFTQSGGSKKRGPGGKPNVTGSLLFSAGSAISTDR